MNTTATSTRICACCKRELSSENFYYNHRTRIIDKYFKECRKKRSRRIINEIDDSLLRMELILRALGKIRASVLRKRKKIQESEYRDFGNNDISG